MNRENKWLLINTAILVVLSAVFILLYALVIPTSGHDNVFGTKVTLGTEEVLEDIPTTANYSIVHTRVNATKGKKEVGDIYTLLIKNGYGEMELLMGIDTKGIVTVNPVSIDQAHYQVPNMNGLIVEQVKKDYKKIEAESLLEFEGELNVGPLDTKASESTGSILDLLQRAVKLHLGIEDTDEFKDLFGEYDAVEDTSIDSELITSKLDVTFIESGETGSIYTLKKNGDYEGFAGAELNGDITLRVLVIEDVIKHIEIVEKEYGHTVGFQPQVRTYLDAWIGTNLSEYPELDSVDLETGSTGSTKLVDSMLRGLRDEYLREPFEDIFGADYEVEVDDAFVPTEHVIKKVDVLVDGQVVGYIFTLKNSGVYHRDSEDVIEMEVAVKDGLISGYIFTIYEHTPGFRGNVEGFIESWIGTDLSSYPTLEKDDLKTNSTNTTTMVDQMFRELRDEYITIGGGD